MLIQAWCYRPRLLAGAFRLVQGTRRPHISLGHHINFNSHFRPKMGIVNKYHEKSILVPKHVAGVYKHHGTLKLCSESFYTLLQGGFRSFMNLNLASYIYFMNLNLARALASSGELRQNSCAAARSSASSGKGSQWVPMTMQKTCVNFGSISSCITDLAKLAKARRSWRQSHDGTSKSHNCPRIR